MKLSDYFDKKGWMLPSSPCGANDVDFHVDPVALQHGGHMFSKILKDHNLCSDFDKSRVRMHKFYENLPTQRHLKSI